MGNGPTLTGHYMCTHPFYHGRHHRGHSACMKARRKAIASGDKKARELLAKIFEEKDSE